MSLNKKKLYLIMKKIVAIYQSFVVPLKSEGIKQMRKDKREAISKVKAYKQLLSDYFKFEKVYLFGSYAKDTFEKEVILMWQ